MSRKSVAIKEKHVDNVLSFCINPENLNGVGCMYRPVNFTGNFPQIQQESIFTILKILNSKGYLSVVFADLPEHQNIHTITPDTSAYEYFIEKEKARKLFWKSWRRNIQTAVFTAIISSLSGALLARISQMLWP